MEALLPCPFCGGDKIVIGYVRDGQTCGCKACGAHVTGFHPGATRRAMDLWNSRATSSEVQSFSPLGGPKLRKDQTMSATPKKPFRIDGSPYWMERSRHGIELFGPRGCEALIDTTADEAGHDLLRRIVAALNAEAAATIMAAS